MFHRRTASVLSQHAICPLQTTESSVTNLGPLANIGYSKVPGKDGARVLRVSVGNHKERFAETLAGFERWVDAGGSTVFSCSWGEAGGGEDQLLSFENLKDGSL